MKPISCPKDTNHTAYCEKDFCKYGEPDCPVVLRGIKDIKPREFWILLQDINNESGIYEQSLIYSKQPENRAIKYLCSYHVIEKSYADSLEARLKKCEELLRELDNAITNNWAYDFGSIERYFDDNK